jgi:endonuclease/exonuclease/phosphatase family metal-dependent hydrolase
MELLNEEALKRTQEMLRDMGREYKYEISPEIRRSQEIYAFLYDKHRVSLVKRGQLYPDPADKFIREPYYATFRSGEFDFTIIVVHVIYNEPVRPCRAEIQELATVFQSIQDADPNEQDILLVGDFNRKPEDYNAFGKLMEIKSMKNLFNLPVKTMIKDTNLYDNILFQRMYVTE